MNPSIYTFFLTKTSSKLSETMMNRCIPKTLKYEKRSNIITQFRGCRSYNRRAQRPWVAFSNHCPGPKSQFDIRLCASTRRSPSTCHRSRRCEQRKKVLIRSSTIIYIARWAMCVSLKHLNLREAKTDGRREGWSNFWTSAFHGEKLVREMFNGRSFVEFHLLRNCFVSYFFFSFELL